MSRRSSHHDMDTLPSASAPRRLSKARVNSATSILSRSTSSVFEPNVSPSISKRTESSLNLSRMLATTPPSESRSHRGSRPELRAHQYSIKYEDTVAEPEERNAIAGAARGVRERLSRTSMLLQHRTSGRMSFSPLTKSSSGLSLLHESADREEDPDAIRAQIREKVHQDTLAALQRVQSSDFDDVDAQGMVPAYRRRSLLTPGLATRNPSDILARPPEPSPSPPLARTETEQHVVAHSDEFPPLIKLASLSHVDAGRSSPVPRATTPALASYETLGGLGLGTLRITNGSDSPTLAPVSASHTRRPSTAPKHHDDSCGSWDARRSTTSSRTALTNVTRSRGNSMSTKTTKELMGQQTRAMATSKAANDPEITRKGSSPKPDAAAPTDSSEDEGLHMAVSVPLRKRRAFSLPPRAAKGSNRSSGVNTTDAPALPSPHASLEHLEATSKAMFDFDDESIRDSVRYSAVEGSLRNWTSFIEDSEHQRPHAESFGEEIMRELSRVASIDVDRSTSEMDETSKTNSMVMLEGMRRSNAISTDSGYGSGASLTSFTGKARSDGTAKTPSAASKSSSRSSLWFFSFKTAAEKPNREQGRGRHASRAPLRAMPGASSGNHSVQSLKHEPERRPVAAARVASQSPGRRKLQKSRPNSMPPPSQRSTAATSREMAAETIPPVPVDIVKRHSLRLNQFSLRNDSFSHGAMDRIEGHLEVGAPLRFPSPTRAPANKSKDKKKKSEAHKHGNAKETAEPKDLARKPSIFSSLRRLSWSSSKRQPPPELPPVSAPPVPNVGAIIDALGDSPYDAARSRSADRSLMGRSSLAQESYQATATAPRPRSQVHLADEQAAELARLRSNDRNRHLGLAMDRGSSSSGSLNGNSNSHYGSTSHSNGKPSRTRSMFAEAPPVPAMPSSFQTMRDHRKGFEPSQRGEGSIIASSANNSMQSLHTRPLNHTPRGSHTHLPSPHNNLPSSSQPQHYSSETPIRRRSCIVVPDSEDENDNRENGNDASASQRLSGRFDGGYLFGYQKGTGVGGSAGTRARGSKASRKSGLMSREFGVDLSDVPVFVAMAT